MAVQYIEIDLKYIDEWKGLEWVHLARDTVKLGGGVYEHGIEPSISKKEWENFEKTKENFVLLNNDCAPWIKSLL
jgi:hypothetical protein